MRGIRETYDFLAPLLCFALIGSIFFWQWQQGAETGRSPINARVSAR